MIRVVVVGVGLEGLIASWVFRQHPDLDVWTIGSPPVGERFDNARPLSYPKHSTSLANLLKSLHVPYASFEPRRGILLRGSIYGYPKHLKSLEKEDAKQIHLTCATKERRRPLSLNAEFKRKHDRKLRCDIGDLTRALIEGSGNQVVPTDDWELAPGMIIVNGRRIAFDFAVVTEPLPVIAERSWIIVPEASSTDRHSAMVVPRDSSQYCPWDSVLTPFTPGNAVHTVKARGHTYTAEVAGGLTESALFSDLNFLFPSGYDLRSIFSAPGEIPEGTASEMRWPDNIAPLGEQAEWRRGVTLDEVTDGAYELLRRWIR